VQTPHSEATARGAAFLAGWRAGVWPDLEALRRMTGDATTFTPSPNTDERERKQVLWRRAVQAVIAFYTPDRRP
jgi:glycerol kinase